MLDLNEIKRDYEIARTPHWWSERNRREAIGKALEQIPVLVEELTQTREELERARTMIDYLQVRIAALGTQAVDGEIGAGICDGCGHDVEHLTVINGAPLVGGALCRTCLAPGGGR